MTPTHRHDTRPRTYRFAPDELCTSVSAGYAVSALHELKERLCDQIVDLPPAGMKFVSGSTGLSIASVFIHVIRTECSRMCALGDAEIPPDIEEMFPFGEILQRPEIPDELLDPARLIGAYTRVQELVTTPIARNIQESDMDARVTTDSRLTTPRALLMHLAWHATYHSGHIGLIRLLWGDDYHWRF